ncbi:MAG TPA: hypothetical protein VJR87_13215 [Allosphingosinicella sp.]|nr:hypothetical protein [Allosphingosinicella sp.]
MTTPIIIINLILIVAFQILGLYLIPMTRGFTEPLPSIGAALAFLIGVPLLARMVHSGANISILMPIVAAAVPLGAVAVGIFAYGESASAARVVALVVACILVGVANML